MEHTPTKEEINELKKDLIQLSNIIKRSDKLIMSMKEPKMKEHYNTELLLLIEQYYLLEKLLKAWIKDYTKWEAKTGSSIDFTMRKLQRQLQKV